MKKVFDITIKDSTGYYIETETEEEAVELALEWFSERKPSVNVSIMSDEEIKDAKENGYMIVDVDGK